MVIEISVAIIALAFVIFVVYAVLLIKALRSTSLAIYKTIADNRKSIDTIALQAEKIAEHTNQLSFDLKKKMDTLHSTFNAVSNVGDLLEEKTETLKKKVHDVEEKEEIGHPQRAYIATDIITLIQVGIHLWQTIRKERSDGS